MGRRGPKRRADSRQTRSITSTPTPDALSLETIPPCPNHLSDQAAEAWGRFARLTFESGRLTQQDLPALELLCQTWAEFLAASEIADDPGQCYVITDKGAVATHPAVWRQGSARKQLCVLLARFGLTPLDRVQVGGSATKKPAGSALSAFAASRAKGS